MTIPLNGFDREEHDGDLHAKNVKLVGSTATIYAVVNTSAAGVGQSIVTVANPVSIAGNVTISDSKGFIGLVTIGGGTIGTTFAGNVTLDPGSKTGVVGNVTLSDSKTFIGLVTVGNTVATTFSGNVTLSDSKTFIGLTSVSGFTNPLPVTQSGTWDEVGINDSGNSITIDGNVGILGNVTLSDSKTFIGLVSVGGGILNTVTAVTDITNPVAIKGNLTLSDSKTFIGLVTAWSRNAGTTKTIDWKPITLSSASILTVFTPTNANKFYITNLLVSSDATVRVSIKSGVTYLTGNATIGVVLNPGGGWAERGSADAPSFIGCASGPLIVEKFDMTGTKANVGGKVVYFEE